jgi:hypothetical protein
MEFLLYRVSFPLGGSRHKKINSLYRIQSKNLREPAKICTNISLVDYCMSVFDYNAALLVRRCFSQIFDDFLYKYMFGMCNV